MSIYRKIYEKHFGNIPKDENGRTYEIHHIDGNRNNNNVTNLKCVSIQEHYDIHYSQGEYSACIRILDRMDMTVEEISKKASEINVERAKKGKHPSQSKKFKDKMRVVKLKELEEGIHPFCNLENLAKWASQGSRKKVEEGTHHFLSSEFHRKTQKKLMKENRHNFMKKVKCPICDREGRSGPMHGHINKCIRQVKEAKNEDV